MMEPWVARFQRFDVRESRLRVGLILGALAVLNLGFYLVLNLPRIQRESRDDARVSYADQALSDLSRRVNLMKGLEERFESEKAKVDRFYDEFLGSKETRMIKIQREIRSIATSFGMDPETITYQPELVEGAGVVRFQIDVPLVGDYRNLRQFISRIEKSEYFLIIDGVGLGDSQGGGALLDLSISLVTYFQTPEVERLETSRAKPGGRT